ncbi:leucine-rich repeat serine/threonine-protein kinase 2-like [Saccostrea echinata]|uniref:leucine-rich repeat serine/threonine-protein kinase 2-like n=1 Tax=Saccostrea echinata TaxID=191078 RepID=UPI002A81C356|nr:leucine-rich repeat serine/threonine-protein kinase 2-like [Saccostrea echinata]
MDVDIIAHKTIHDVCIHEAVIRLLRIPKEVLEWDDERRERFVQELKDGKVRVHRARIIIVGCAGAGKTTLVERLKHPNNDEMPTTTTTVGLDVHRNVFHVDDGRLISMENTTSITVSSREEKMITLMDFAGQSAYYACHQVFLTKRAIYVLVSDMSKCMDDKVSQLECDTKGTVFADWKHGDYIRFWLQSIRTYCGENMPVVLVATHKDKNTSNENFFDEILHSLPEEQNLKKHISTQRYFEIGATPEDKEKIFDIQKLLLHLLSPENGEQQYSHWGEFIPSFC